MNKLPPRNAAQRLSSTRALQRRDFSVAISRSWLGVKTNAPLNDSIVLSKHEAFSTNGYMMVINNNFDGGAPGKVTFWQSSLPSHGTVSTTTVNDNAWHQIVGVYRAGVSEAIYIDGSPVEATNGVAAMISNTAPFLIGGQSQSGTPTAYYDGLIDEVEVYNHALTSAEVQARFDSVAEPSTAVFGALSSLVLLLRRNRNQRSA
jgi:hypothetical protein